MSNMLKRIEALEKAKKADDRQMLIQGATIKKNREVLTAHGKALHTLYKHSPSVPIGEAEFTKGFEGVSMSVTVSKEYYDQYTADKETEEFNGKLAVILDKDTQHKKIEAIVDAKFGKETEN